MGTSIDKQGNVITGLGSPINVNENLFRMSAMNAEAQANFAPNNSTDWTKYFRYYNGSAAIHSFKNGVDTITLNQDANLGIAFQRSATDIELDPNSYYIISCEAKCSKESATLDTGLSYYKTSNLSRPQILNIFVTVLQLRVQMEAQILSLYDTVN